MLIAVVWLGLSFSCAAGIIRVVEQAGDFAFPAVFPLSIGAMMSFFTAVGTLFGRGKDGALVGLWAWILGCGILLLWELGRVPR
jgi:hypothetical protein